MAEVKVEKVPEDIAGKFLNHSEMNAKCDNLVQFAIVNHWDRDTLIQWITVAWLDSQQGKSNVK